MSAQESTTRTEQTTEIKEIKEVITQLHPLERKTFPVLEKIHAIPEIAKKTGLQEVEVMRAVQWLQNKGLAEVKEEIKELVSLDKNGQEYLTKSLPERRFLEALGEQKILAELQKAKNLNVEEINICIGLLRGRNLITIEKTKNNETLIKRTQEGRAYLKSKQPEEEFLEAMQQPRELKSLNKEEELMFKYLLKRKQIIKTDVKKIRTATLTAQGKELVKVKIDESNIIDKVTPEMLRTGSWKKKQLRAYDVTSNVPEIDGGKRHFVNQTITYAKQIWLDLGFEEMTGNMVQTAFWNLDCLFVPQDHPAREMQDTFYLKSPAKGTIPAKLAQTIKATHENGWKTGSTGWKTPWSEEKAKELLLRTHTTVLSALKLAELKKEDLPKKFFNVGKVFRNEALDWKHLFEFYQVDGIVVDPNANFKNLLGYLKDFFGKMGYADIRIRPAHFPYTEPSAEIEVLHPIKKEWIELGGCGIFRPEVTTPLLGFECPVLAWGFGLGRIMCPQFNITDLRDLYKNDIKQLKKIKIWVK